jgi:hypothetical protein
MLLGLLAGSTLARGSPLKGVTMTVLGLILGIVGIDGAAVERLRAQPDPQHRQGLADRSEQRSRARHSDGVEQRRRVAHRSPHHTLGIHSSSGVGFDAGNGAAARWLQADEAAMA